MRGERDGGKGKCIFEVGYVGFFVERGGFEEVGGDDVDDFFGGVFGIFVVIIFGGGVGIGVCGERVSICW